MKGEWKENLKAVYDERNRGLQHTKDHAREFFETTVEPALSALQDELEEYGHTVTLVPRATSQSLYMSTGSDDALEYAVHAEVYPDRLQIFTRSSFGAPHQLTNPNEPYTGLTGINEEMIIEDFLKTHWLYMRQLTAKDWRNL